MKPIYRSTNLRPEHAQAWDRLAQRAGMNNNTFIRFLLLNLKDEDLDKLLARITQA